MNEEKHVKNEQRQRKLWRQDTIYGEQYNGHTLNLVRQITATSSGLSLQYSTMDEETWPPTGTSSSLR
jgi:hypothetical protein